MSEAKILRELREIKEMVSIQSDIISEKDAADLLGIKIKSLQSRVSEKKLEGCFLINALGRRNYFRSKLLNLK